MTDKCLSVRLQGVADLVTRGNVLVDVGTDHGYLPIYLVSRGVCPRAIAMDVRPGPLSKARANIAMYGLAKRISLRLSDGLAALSPGEGDSLVLSGMGGPLMQEILSRDMNLVYGFRELILQPQSDIPGFRRFLTAAGFTINAENMVVEDGKYYPMMRAVKKEEAREEVPDREVPVKLQEEYGGWLLRERSPVLKEWLVRQDAALKALEKTLRQASSEKALQRLLQVQDEIRLVGEALEWYAKN